MSRVRNKDGPLEVRVRKYLFSKGFRYRKNSRRLVGKPDIVLPKYGTVVFIHGCFWHKHGECRRSALPVSNHDFWKAKIERNVLRDRKVTEKLQTDGWRVLTVWQCEIRNQRVSLDRLEKLLREITG